MFEPSRSEVREVFKVLQDQIEKLSTTASMRPSVGLRWNKKAEPINGNDLCQLIKSIIEEVEDSTVDTGSGGYLAYVPGGGIFSACVADFLAVSLNRYVGIWDLAPVCVQIEKEAIQTLGEFIGLNDAKGILTSGGSLANLSAVIAARDTKVKNISKAVAYCSDQVHHSIEKCLKASGLGLSQLRKINSDQDFKIDLKELEHQIEADLRTGLEPFLVVGTAGTTNTGAIDSLSAIAEICEKRGLWFHVDGAYGGVFAKINEFSARFEGLSRADSVTIDPHKGLFLPYGTGALLVRNEDCLKEAFSKRADYLPDLSASEGTNFNEISLELSRDFRGLRVWLPFRVHGSGSFKNALCEKIALRKMFEVNLKQVDGIEVGASGLTVVCFRMKDDSKNRELLDYINESRDVFISDTRLRGIYHLRICVLSYATREHHIEKLLALIRTFVETRS